MTSPDTPASGPTLNSLEILGLLSARVIHSLSNHLVVITGNICAAGGVQNDPQQLSSALHAALTAANSAGSFLDEFSVCRRGFKDNAGSASVEELNSFLKGWVESKPGWTRTVEMPGMTGRFVPLSVQMVRFVLDSIVHETQTTAGSLEIFARDTSGVRISMNCREARPIDWDLARTHLKNMRLTAAYEILSQVGAKPASRSAGEGSQLTSFVLPLTTGA